MTDIVDIYLETGDFHEAVKQSGLPTHIAHLKLIKSGCLKIQDKIQYGSRTAKLGRMAEELRDVLLTGGCGADAGGSRGQVTRRWGRGDLGGRIRECVNQQHRDHQRDSGAQDGGEV